MTLKLTAQFAAREKELQVTYTATNLAPATAYLLNALWRPAPDGKPQADPRPAYVSVADTTLYVAQAVHPLPKQLLVELRNVPFARALERNATYTGTFQLPLPVKEYNPYYPEEDGAAWADVAVKAAEFWLGYVVADKELKTHPTPLAPAVRLEHPLLLSLVQTAKAARQPVTATGKRRTDPFERLLG